MTHRKALQGFPDTSQASLHIKIIKSTSLFFFSAVPARTREVSDAFNFISERNAYIT
jgi:hypothetical protein